MVLRSNIGNYITSSKITSSNVVSSATSGELVLGKCIYSGDAKVLSLVFVRLTDGEICGRVTKVYTANFSL